MLRSEYFFTDSDADTVVDASDDGRLGHVRLTRGIASHDTSDVYGEAEMLDSLGPFVLSCVLGRGNHGIVRLGTHKETQFRVAIKFVPKLALNANSGARWQTMKSEIALLKLLYSPYIARYYDIVETPQYVCVVFEYIPGGELFDLITIHGRCDRVHGLSMFFQLLLEVDYLHTQSFCHRDIKVENILVDDNYNIKLIDLGMAKMKSTATMMTTACGSPHYASPELMSMMPYTLSTDIWSLGVVLYAIIFGGLPFDHENMGALVKLVIKGDYKIPAGTAMDKSFSQMTLYKR